MLTLVTGRKPVSNVHIALICNLISIFENLKLRKSLRICVSCFVNRALKI